MSAAVKKLVGIGILVWLLWPKKSAGSNAEPGKIGLMIAAQPFDDTMYIHLFNGDQSIHETLVVPPFYDSIESITINGIKYSAGWNFDVNHPFLLVEDIATGDSYSMMFDEYGSIIDDQSGS